MTSEAVRTLEPATDVSVTPDLACALLRLQHPDLADRPITLLDAGWDNVMLRLGDDLALRMPCRATAASLILNEQAWLPVLAPALPLPIPTPVRVGGPALGYPYAWSVTPFIEGEPADLAPPDRHQGERLATFLKALHRPAPDNAPLNPYRGVPLGNRAEVFEARLAVAELARGAMPDVRQAWASALAAPIDTPRTWLHGDLHGRNVLTRDGRLAAVIDWGDLTAGDPACDLASVWMLLPDPAARADALAAYAPTPATIARARGWAALMGVTLASITNNPRMPAMGLGTIARLAADGGAS
ncbi:MAG TPA: aminoglycoside phosphotransferase family protein [Caulobacteraceae bacterium]|jgi:aminoglycoside phosphotransferase (APT) family kinase protein